MNKFFATIVLIWVSGTFCFSQELNQIKFDENADKEILFGNCNLDGLTTPPFDGWYYEEFNSYEPDIDVLNNLESTGGLASTDITIVMGTWCSDSRREVPRFYKLFENLDYNINSIKLINVDTKKEAEGTIVSDLNIERVPTIIFFREGKEIGRIIETPEESLEADMLRIVGE